MGPGIRSGELEARHHARSHLFSLAQCFPKASPEEVVFELPFRSYHQKQTTDVGIQMCNVKPLTSVFCSSSLSQAFCMAPL